MDKARLRTLPLRALPWICAALPPLFMLFLIGAWRQQVPFYDDWEFVNYYRDLESGKLDWRSLFAQYNEHRLVVLKVAVVAMFRWFDGDWGALCYLGFATALATLGQILFLARPLLSRGRLMPAVLCAAVSLAVFSPAQGQVWLWGVTFVVFLPVALLLACILVLRTSWPAWVRFTACLFLCQVSAYSHGTGVVTWVAITVYLIMAAAPEKRRGMREKWWFLGIWAGAGLALTALQFLGYQMSGAAEKSTASFAERIPTAFTFLGAVLGGHLGIGTAFSPLAFSALLGEGLLVAFAAALVWLWLCRHDRALWHEAAPWVALCVASLLAGGLITGSRFGLGLEQALETRYNTSCVGLSVGLLLLYVTLWRKYRIGPWPRAAVALYLALLVTSAAAGIHYMRVWHVWRLQAAAPVAWARFFEPDASRLSFPVQTSVLDRAEYLEAEGMLRQITLAAAPDLSIYRVSKSPLTPSRAVFDTLVPGEAPGQFHASGFAFVQKGARPADLVLLVARDAKGGGKVVAIAPMRAPENLFRFDRERKLPQARQYYGGWHCAFSAESLPAGEFVLRAYALDLPERRVYPIGESEYRFTDRSRADGIGAR